MVLPTPLGPTSDDVGGVLEEVERHQRLEGGAVTAFGPGPIEVADGFEAADMGLLEATLQAAAGPLLLLPIEQRFDPASGGGRLGDRFGQ